MTAADVIAGERLWSVECGDCLEWAAALPDDSLDLCVFSPPYEAARTYGIGFGLRGQGWVDWMVRIVRILSAKCRGLIAINCEGQTRNYAYSATPFLLMADLHREGFNLRKPVVFRRIGIPGSGGPDWFRNDWEPVICVTRPGKLPWSDNVACGHPPKWAPGGAMSNRTEDGQRKNARGCSRNQWGGTGGHTANRKPDGGKDTRARPSHRFGHAADGTVKGGHAQDIVKPRKIMTVARDVTHSQESTYYEEPAIANPGNVLELAVGGGVMGHALAHENEAPYPLGLPSFFVKSCCPPNGIVCDVFSGSGTTAHAAIDAGRRFVGCDVRQSQVDLTIRRMRSITRPMIAA